MDLPPQRRGDSRAPCDTVAEAIAVGSPCSVRGVRRVALDPSNPAIVYAGSYQRGVWRSPDAGATWTQIKPSLNAADATMRPELAVTTLANGNTRMYVHEGSTGSPTSRLFRSDSVATGVPVFTNLSSSNVADAGYGTHNVCTGQCWYDNFVYTPAGHPDIVYVGGSYSYGEQFSNKRGVVLSTDAGVTSTDMTMDATDFEHPNGLHPDQHAIVTNPTNPFQFFEVNDGGIMRSSGEFADVSWWCDARTAFVNDDRAAARSLQAAAVARADGAGGHEQGLRHAAVPEPLGEPVQLEPAPGRHAGQRHVADARQSREVGEHDDRRRRPVGLRRRPSRRSASTRSSTRRRT